MVPDGHRFVHESESGELSVSLSTSKWSILSKSMEFFIFWFIVIIIIYGFVTAVLLYLRNEEAIRRIKESIDSESNDVVNNSNQHTLCEGELYPTIRLSGDHEFHYLIKVDHNNLTAQQTASGAEELQPGKRSDIEGNILETSN
ncbi:hypothetical protein HG537_0E03500 [Torulaspora globosa]|uniref:Uncharacterized protein n=1 Tax=Torulaspora globosa TaxID=48254 RepID=A0A7H9HWY8_9SACH|nr:hypothetical protein HG537_0E03500 [Torulaspora sp. CBS 2947]